MIGHEEWQLMCKISIKVFFEDPTQITPEKMAYFQKLNACLLTIDVDVFMYWEIHYVNDFKSDNAISDHVLPFEVFHVLTLQMEHLWSSEAVLDKCLSLDVIDSQVWVGVLKLTNLLEDVILSVL